MLESHERTASYLLAPRRISRFGRTVALKTLGGPHILTCRFTPGWRTRHVSMTTPVEPKVDGRRARRERSREAVVEALLDLIREGRGVPSARDIAEKAGVTERTLFNLFADKQQLLLAAVVRFRSYAEDTMPSVPKNGSLHDRVHTFFDAFAPFLEEYSALRWAAVTHEGVPDVQRGVVLTRVRQRLAELLAPDGIDLDADPTLGAAITVAADPLTWRLYRVQQGLSFEAAREAMVFQVLTLARTALGNR